MRSVSVSDANLTDFLMHSSCSLFLVFDLSCRQSLIALHEVGLHNNTDGVEIKNKEIKNGI